VIRAIHRALDNVIAQLPEEQPAATDAEPAATDLHGEAHSEP